MDPPTAYLKKNRVFNCLECGKCTAVCPISRFNGTYSPRRFASRGIFYGSGDIGKDNLLWSCLTCKQCSLVCPANVNYSEFMRDARVEARQMGYSGNPSHSGALHYIMEMTASPDLKQKRTGWITEDLKICKEGEMLLFVGCLPYYDDFFSKDLDFSPIDIAKDSIKILNHLGIVPVVLEDERCCGHDFYWSGDLENFMKLAELNLKEFEKAGVKTIVTACPEGALTLKKLYPEQFGAVSYSVLHLSELIAENLDKFKLNEIKSRITFQDPCRLGRYLDIYEAPRKVMSAIPGAQFQEMQRSGKKAVCCGTSAWTNCDSYSKQIQSWRLKEAKGVGADILVTACPKCQIHFRCANKNEENGKNIDIEIKDLVSLFASALE
ncbi:MAG: (Fe-S)-binding protein [Candidatus Zixiibacteriota bacterium]|nr:MAG: (Fe-S)-binding protein [candidate division Zixibacteria bacterium]